MFSNITTAVFSGTGITLALFYVMQLLITMQPEAASIVRERGTLQFLPDLPPEEPVKSVWEIKPDPISDPPALPDVPINQGDPTIGYTVPIQPPAPPPDRQSGIGFTVSDGMLVNIVRVGPVYPTIAQARGLEGYVIVRFDVMANGTVTNVSVVESSNRIFERPALDAAKRFRYRAQVVDGVPQPTHGIQYAFRFEME